MLLLSSLEAHTGNMVTASRLCSICSTIAAHCEMLDPKQFDGPSDLRAHVRSKSIVMVVGIHAYRSGRLLVGLDVPYSIVLGGTDVK